MVPPDLIKTPLPKLIVILNWEKSTSSVKPDGIVRIELFWTKILPGIIPEYIVHEDVIIKSPEFGTIHAFAGNIR